MEDGATGLGTTFKISSTTFLLFPSLLLRIPAWVPAIGVTGSCTVFSSALLNKCLFTIILICEIAFITRVGAATYTIDNMDILIRYTGPWIPSSECSDNCVASPEPSRTYAGTWHVATWGNASRSIEYTSKGTEIAFYGILVYGSSRETPWNINISLTVDEERMQSYYLYPPLTNITDLQYTYDMGVLKKSGLSDTAHTTRVDLIPPTQFIFDYLTYRPDYQPEHTPANSSGTETQSGPLNPSDSSSQLNATTSSMLGENHPDSKVLDGPAISGIVIGIVILLISGLFLCRCIYRRKQRQRKENQDGGITPLPYEITRRGRRSKPRTGMTSSSTTDLLPGGSNENTSETYPMTSYPLNPRNRIARMQENGNGGGGEGSRQDEVAIPNTTERGNTSQTAGPQREDPLENVVPIPLVAPMPVNLSVARREARRQGQQRTAVGPHIQRNLMPRIEYHESSRNIQDGR